MPAKKTKEEQYDPFKRPGASATPKPTQEVQRTAPAIPMAITPRFSFAQGGQQVLDSPVAELIRFGEVLLARCDNDAMFICNDGKTWHRFVFEIIAINQEV